MREHEAVTDNHPQPAAQRAIVTGGASGIGRAAATLLGARGWHVVVIDIDDGAGAELSRTARLSGHAVDFLRADISDEDETRAAMADAVSILGGVDVLVTAAGIMRGQLLDIREHDEAMWDEVIDVNLKGAFLAVRAVAPVMLERGAGSIILVASKGGVAVGSGSFSYGASKGGVHGLALTLERHLGPAGIRVNDVCPGNVDTPLFRRSIREGVERGADAAAAEEALADLTTPGAVAELIAFLASDAASAVRGTVFTA